VRNVFNELVNGRLCHQCLNMDQFVSHADDQAGVFVHLNGEPSAPQLEGFGGGWLSPATTV